MRSNPVKDQLAAGDTAWGTMVFEFLSAGLPQILQNAGADFVFYDMEHSGFSMAEMKTQLALCRGLDIVPLVRPPATTYQHTSRLLDLGAMGILFQMCETAEQAEEFVRWTRYPPSGQRGAMFGGAPRRLQLAVRSGDHRGRPRAHHGLCSHRVGPGCGECGRDHVGARCGCGAPWHGDLSLSLEVPGQTDHPSMQAGIDTILAACEQHGSPPHAWLVRSRPELTGFGAASGWSATAMTSA